MMMDERENDEKNVMGCREELRMRGASPPTLASHSCLPQFGKLWDYHQRGRLQLSLWGGVRLLPGPLTLTLPPLCMGKPSLGFGQADWL